MRLDIRRGTLQYRINNNTLGIIFSFLFLFCSLLVPFHSMPRNSLARNCSSRVLTHTWNINHSSQSSLPVKCTWPNSYLPLSFSAPYFLRLPWIMNIKNAIIQMGWSALCKYIFTHNFYVRSLRVPKFHSLPPSTLNLRKFPRTEWKTTEMIKKNFSRINSLWL